MRRQIKRCGQWKPGPGLKEQPMSASDQNPQRILSKRLASADFQNACLKSELARQRALTADLVYGISEVVS